MIKDAFQNEAVDSVAFIGYSVYDQHHPTILHISLNCSHEHLLLLYQFVENNFGHVTIICLVDFTLAFFVVSKKSVHYMIKHTKMSQ